MVTSGAEGRVVGGPGPLQLAAVKFTFGVDPIHRAFRGTLLFEVNFTAPGNHCQKYLRGRLGNLVKFTF